jgi:GTPase SAR1 family protein
MHIRVVSIFLQAVNCCWSLPHTTLSLSRERATAMKTPTFEIRVALLGYVSAGKSTVLNALLQGKFSQVGMRRTTAGVHHFRLHTKPNEEHEDDDTSYADKPREDERDKENIDRSETADTASVMNESWGSEPEDMLDAAGTLQKIARDNSRLRETNQLQESTFDVELDEPLCPMRPDTKMVLIDIPGLNEAGSNDLFRGYVNDKWDTFDCVIAVMDIAPCSNASPDFDVK